MAAGSKAAEDAIEGLRDDTLLVLMLVAHFKSVPVPVVATAMKTSRWRARRRLRKLVRRGLVVAEREDERGTWYAPTALGEKAAFLATLVVSIGDFEPDKLEWLRTEDRKRPFGRARQDDLL